jgi:uncharacterized protein (TIGR02118 family)
MITRFGMGTRKAGTTAEEFQAHWRTSHADVVRGMGGLTRYWQNHAVLRDGEPLLPWPGFDACAQIEGESIADLDRAFSSPHFLSAVRPDERDFLDLTRGGYMLCELAHAEGSAQAGSLADTVRNGVRLLTFMRLSPLASQGPLAQALHQPLDGGEWTGREIYLALTGMASGQRFSQFDALETLWFVDAQAAERYVCSVRARERRTQLAGLVWGTERLIARVNAVI